MQQQPEMVGQKGMATQAVGLELQLQFLDTIFHVAPQHVNVIIDKLGVATKVSDHKALIGDEIGTFQLGDDPTGPGPAPTIFRQNACAIPS